MADEFDFFIAHAGTDGPAAEELYAHLSLEAHVFLDRRCLLPGDDWDRKLPNAQRSSLITVVLISTHSQQAYYEREEIATAIDMARGDPDRHRVVPVFLDRGSYGREDIPYGLRLKHSLSVEEVGSLGEVARKLLDLLRQLREGKQARTPVPSLSGVKPPEWLRSSTAGFLGQTERGPVTPTLVTSWLDYKGLFGGDVDPAISFLSHSVKGFFENGGERAYVARILGPMAATASLTLATTNVHQCLKVAVLSPGIWGNRLALKVQDGTRIGIRLSVSREPARSLLSEANPVDSLRDTLPNLSSIEALEDYDNLGWDPDGPNYLLNINGKSNWVTLQWCEPLKAPARPSNTYSRFSGGADGTDLTATAYIGDRAAQTGLVALEDLDDISLLCVPDHVHPRLGEADQLKIVNELVDQCERRHDRFAILSVTANIKNVSTIRPPRDSKLAAIYYPWICVSDSYSRRDVLIPPIGHIAGIYARSDAERGVHISPIDFEVRGLKIASNDRSSRPLEIDVTPEQLDTLVRLGGNAIRDIGTTEHDVRVVGARTMAIDERWKSIAQQRFSIFIAQSLERGSSWVRFEPNDEHVWTKLRENISSFLTTLWEVGALRGDSAEEAFFVRCDRNTTTQNDIDNGRLVCVVGVSCVEPQVPIVFELVIPVANPASSKLRAIDGELGNLHSQERMRSG